MMDGPFISTFLLSIQQQSVRIFESVVIAYGESGHRLGERKTSIMKILTGVNLEEGLNRVRFGPF